MGADKLDALLSKRRRQLLFHVPLRRPTLLICGKPQIAARNEQYFIRCRLYGLTPLHCHVVPLLATARYSAREKYTPRSRPLVRPDPR
jgi:hypothetical protein